MLTITMATCVAAHATPVGGDRRVIVDAATLRGSRAGAPAPAPPPPLGPHVPCVEICQADKACVKTCYDVRRKQTPCKQPLLICDQSEPKSGAEACNLSFAIGTTTTVPCRWSTTAKKCGYPDGKLGDNTDLWKDFQMTATDPTLCNCYGDPGLDPPLRVE
jgi:hypothetical protein